MKETCPCGKELNGSPFGVCSAECASTYIDGKNTPIVRYEGNGRIKIVSGGSGSSISNSTTPMTNPANTGGGGAFIQGKSPLIGIAETNTHANEWREEFMKTPVLQRLFTAESIAMVHGMGQWTGKTVQEELDHLLDTERAHLVERLQKLEKKKSKIGFENPGTKMQQIKQRVFAQGFNQALDQAIDIVKDNK